jgi:hypothetical protein
LRMSKTLESTKAPEPMLTVRPSKIGGSHSVYVRLPNGIEDEKYGFISAEEADAWRKSAVSAKWVEEIKGRYGG